MSVFKKVLPVVVTSFVNKCGDIGMYLFPMLLVEKSFSTHQASSILFFAKTALLVGTFSGGWFCQKIGHKGTLILSLCFAGLGLSLIPLSQQFWWLCFFAIVTRFGHGIYQTPIRLLVAYVVEQKQQRESFAYLRTVNNLAQIVGYGLSYAGSQFGLLPFFLFDGLTSFFSALLGVKIIPNIKIQMHEEKSKSSKEKTFSGDFSAFIVVVLCMSGFSFLIDLFMIGTSAYCKIHLGEAGLKTFSLIMVLNTLLCSLLAIVASRRVENPRKTFPLGLLLCGSGFLFVLESHASLPILFLGTLVMTLGEIIFATIAQVELLRVIPNTKNKNHLYSTALVVQSVGRILGASVAFPILEKGHIGTLYVAVFLLCFVTVSFFMKSKERQNAPLAEINEAEIPSDNVVNS